MKALVTSGRGPLDLRLESVADPVPRSDEVLVEVRATSVNRADLLLAARQPVGSQLGLDVVGTVVRAAADGSGPPLTSRVTGLASTGAWAELATVRTDRLATVPDGVSDTDAAALPVAGLTALYALQRAGWLLGRRVLVTAAGGGVGRFAVQLAAAGGAAVLAWVGSPERGQGLADFGAQVLSGYDRPPAEPVDILLDSVGGEVFSQGYRQLTRGATAVVFGNTERAELRLPADWGHARPGVRLEYLFLLDEICRRPAGADLALLARLVQDGRLDPQVGVLAGWTDAAGAIQALLDRRVNGKVVLSV
ncbi:NADPH2:quinone reductase [Kitasatospora sp. MAA4]|uniref:zinc-binding dehydrogenase n=1 Tax=Kitasatospora sp. MAA4 TaxID=3035093 RepID=UPI002474F7D5|nr:zinc-binding dehydrogenase [Kitasatospora sp. MAA4]MDH6132405.1 NADPH2:quinone reductase [Kitasatospora sp. MAA4]